MPDDAGAIETPERPSREAAELVRRLMGEIGHGRLEEVLALTHREVELRSLMGQVEGGAYQGHAGVREWFRDVIETFAPFDPGVREIEETADAALAVGRARGRARASGMEFEWDWAALIRSRDGKVVQLSVYRDREELRRAEKL